MSEPRSLKEELIATDEHFRRLYESHLECKRQLEELRRQALPSQDDEIEAKRIKVRKLQLKDEMETILRQHEIEHEHVSV